ncbi:tail fiber assembly protein [Pseudomonas putida]|uniref:tail fiber assembly protein n=1 Tax=Pseudomonas putida TaxID=303 RepID=UPI003D984A65
MSTNIDWSQLITRAMKEQAANDQVLVDALAENAKCRTVADKAIAPLQDAVDIDEATDAEVLLWKAWKKYRVALNRVPEQLGYPATIDWPVAPA